MGELNWRHDVETTEFDNCSISFSWFSFFVCVSFSLFTFTAMAVSLPCALNTNFLGSSSQVTVYLQVGNFLQIWIFTGQSRGRKMIWKSFWKRLNIGGEMAVLLCAGSKNIPFNWQPYGACAINWDDFCGIYLYGCHHKLTSQLIHIVVLTTKHFWSWV